ncbi:hypothetical protein [Nocardia sp. SC052]|uniref:hypothetical protein n=1 Tax=Nocardia sichangensis TaxID=3385975 RepID=UPI0039A35F2F
MKVLGVAVSSGVLYYGALNAPDGLTGPTIIPDAPERLVPAEGLDGAGWLLDTFERITQDIRTLEPEAIALVGTRKYSQWKYREAVDRISLISALMLSCAQQSVAYRELTTEQIGKAVALSPSSLFSFSYETIGLTQRPTHWTAGRGAAFAAALAYAVDRSQN